MASAVEVPTDSLVQALRRCGFGAVADTMGLELEHNVLSGKVDMTAKFSRDERYDVIRALSDPCFTTELHEELNTLIGALRRF
jgi:hypothetical protein